MAKEGQLRGGIYSSGNQGKQYPLKNQTLIPSQRSPTLVPKPPPRASESLTSLGLWGSPTYCIACSEWVLQ